MLSPAERKFLRLYLKGSNEGDLNELNTEYKKGYQAVLWNRIKKKDNPISKDYSLIRKAYKERAHWKKVLGDVK